MIIKDFSEYINTVIYLRRVLHKFPELSGEEYKTCEFIIENLKKFGVKNIEKMYNTGVVALIGDEKKECIAIRCDIDALPIKEETNLPYKSQNDGVMHACAHDAHTAVVLTLAKILCDNENKLSKCIKLIFQPKEETDGGAKQMIDEGVLENPKVDKVFGFHFWSNIDCGKITYQNGVSFASCSRFEIRIKGKGGHGAMPEKVINSLIPVSYIIDEFQKINKKYEKAVVSLCTCNTDGSYNVFCENAVLKGTIRTIYKEDYEKIVEEILSMKDKVLKEYGCECEIDVIYEYPALVNDKDALRELLGAAKYVLGNENVYESPFTYAAEDFSFFTEAVKSAHIKIGSSNKERPETLLPLHNPSFDIDENALGYALEIFSKLCF